MPPSSPRILTKAPKGIRLTEYNVSPNFLPKRRGGYPMPNSSTLTPNFLAIIKWPNSWMIIKAIRLKNATNNVTYIIQGKLHNLLRFLVNQIFDFLLEFIN